jgi:hypothetical protein
MRHGASPLSFPSGSSGFADGRPGNKPKKKIEKTKGVRDIKVGDQAARRPSQ